MTSKRSLRIVLPFHTTRSLRTSLGWYINLRWLAIFALLTSIPLGKNLLHFQLGYSQISVVACILLCINIIFFLIYRHMPEDKVVSELAFAEVQIVSDMVIVSFLIHYAGGISNPFFFLYIVQVIFSAILLPAPIVPVINAIIASILLTLWAVLEYSGAVPSFNLGLQEVSLGYMITALFAFYITNFAGLFIINNFMIRYRTLKEMIDEKNRLLVRSMQERRAIFRYAAHELKSPITVIKSTLHAVRVLAMENLPPEIAELVERGETRSHQVLEMVNEMIEITRYNEGMERHEARKINFESWLDDVVKLQRDVALSKNIELSVKPFPQTIKVKIDPVEFEKIVRNLVSNALRYTPEGGRVSIEPFKDNDGYGFSVQDTGIGIEKKDLKRIFNEFYRAPNAKMVERVGTGLGLVLVQQVVKRHHGHILVTSTVGQGSRFTVKFPYSPKPMRENSTVKADFILK